MTHLSPFDRTEAAAHERRAYERELKQQAASGTARPLDTDLIAALRLAFAAGEDNTAKVVVAERLLSYAYPSDPAAIAPVRLLVQAIRATDAELVVK